MIAYTDIYWSMTYCFIITPVIFRAILRDKYLSVCPPQVAGKVSKIWGRVLQHFLKENKANYNFKPFLIEITDI